MSLILPQGFRVRPPTLEDARSVVDLFAICQQAEFGVSEANLEDTLALWQSPGVDLAKDIGLIFSPNAQLAAYLHLVHSEPLRMLVIVRVHPDYADLGLHASLLEYAEESAREFIAQVRADVRVSLHASCSGSNHVYKQSIEQAGFVHVRSEWRMEIEMFEPPPEPVWPEGIELRPFTLEMARAVHAADKEAFSDHWGFTPDAFDYATFEHWLLASPRFDATLWFLTYAGEKIVGSALCESREEMAWVNSLSVLRPWRRKGLGLALLHHAFGEFYRRGQCKVALFVDAQSLTGATRLYKRAGMRCVRQFDKYEKELRPGIELSVQALADEHVSSKETR